LRRRAERGSRATAPTEVDGGWFFLRAFPVLLPCVWASEERGEREVSLSGRRRDPGREDPSRSTRTRTTVHVPCSAARCISRARRPTSYDICRCALGRAAGERDRRDTRSSGKGGLATETHLSRIHDALRYSGRAVSHSHSTPRSPALTADTVSAHTESALYTDRCTPPHLHATARRSPRA